MTHQPTPDELRRGSLQALADMKTLATIKDTSVALIGGQAVLHYLDRFRTTQDVDILTTAIGAPSAVKNLLLKNFPDRYRQVSEQFEVKIDSHWIHIDMVPGDFGPTVPALSHLIRLDKLGSDMPWAGVADLIVTKMFSAPLRTDKSKRETDLRDITALAEFGYKEKSDYTKDQKDWVKKETEEDKELFKVATPALKRMFNF